MDRLCRTLLIVAVLGAAFTLAVLAVRAPCLAALAALAFASPARRGMWSGGDAYGTAKFCSEEDARKAGML